MPASRRPVDTPIIAMGDENLELPEIAPNSTLGEGAGAAPKNPGYAENQAAIAAILGVDERTFRRWAKLPGAPEDDDNGYPIEKWIAFAATVRRKSNAPDKATAELEGQLLKNKRAQLEYEKEIGNLLSVDQVAELLAGMGNAFATRLNGAKYSLGPLVVGETVPEATKRIGLEHYRCLQELSVPDWAKKKAGPPGLFWSKVWRILSALPRTENLGDGLKRT